MQHTRFQETPTAEGYPYYGFPASLKFGVGQGIECRHTPLAASVQNNTRANIIQHHTVWTFRPTTSKPHVETRI